MHELLMIFAQMLHHDMLHFLFELFMLTTLTELQTKLRKSKLLFLDKITAGFPIMNPQHCLLKIIRYFHNINKIYGKLAFTS